MQTIVGRVVAMMPRRKFRNVLACGVAFMLFFTALGSVGIIQKTVMESIQEETPEFNANAYVSLAIIFAFFAFANWITPSVIYYLTPKWTMAVGAVGGMFFTASFLAPSKPLLYVTSCFYGIGCGFLWTAQGEYLTVNSDNRHVVRDWGLFWTIYQSSLLFGNILVYFEFEGKTHIDVGTRVRVFGGLLAVGAASLVAFCCLNSFSSAEVESSSSSSSSSSAPSDEEQCSKTKSSTSAPESADPQHFVVLEGGGEPSAAAAKTSGAVLTGPWHAFVSAVELFLTPNMALLSVGIAYTGIDIAFYSGVYSGAVGFTERFGPDRTKFVGVSGMLIGVGEIVGGLFFGIMGNKTIRFGRGPAYALGSVAHLTSFVAAFINLPDKSVFGPTGDPALIESKMWLAMVCSFLLGFGDATMETQFGALISSLYPDRSGLAFALFMFSQCAAASIAFFYSTVLGLRGQLAILAITCIAGTVTFWMVARRSKI